jgi:hypothetical protein
MTRTVVALFDDFNDASGAVRDLVDNGFSRDDISLMASDPENQYSRYIGSTPEEEATGAAQGAGVGAGIGAVVGGLGGLLVGLGASDHPRDRTDYRSRPTRSSPHRTCGGGCWCSSRWGHRGSVRRSG